MVWKIDLSDARTRVVKEGSLGKNLLSASGPIFPGLDPGPAQGLTWASLGLDPGQPKSAQAKKLVKKWFLGK